MSVAEKVIRCMPAMQRYPWEQGVCAQAAFVMADAWRKKLMAVK